MKSQPIPQIVALVTLCGLLSSCGYLGAANRTISRHYNAIRSFNTDAEREAFFQALRETHHHDPRDKAAAPGTP